MLTFSVKLSYKLAELRFWKARRIGRKVFVSVHIIDIFSTSTNREMKMTGPKIPFHIVSNCGVRNKIKFTNKCQKYREKIPEYYSTNSSQLPPYKIYEKPRPTFFFLSIFSFTHLYLIYTLSHRECGSHIYIDAIQDPYTVINNSLSPLSRFSYPIWREIRQPNYGLVLLNDACGIRTEENENIENTADGLTQINNKEGIYNKN